MTGSGYVVVGADVVGTVLLIMTSTTTPKTLGKGGSETTNTY
jgi:hypothetical protein